jgi:hypothetical protein
MAIEPVYLKHVRTTKESILSNTITPVARRFFYDSTGKSTTGYLSRHSISTVVATNLTTPFIGLQYVQTYIIKEGSASLLLRILTRDFCLAATAAVMSHIEETGNAVFFNHLLQFTSKYEFAKAEWSLIASQPRIWNSPSTCPLGTTKQPSSVSWTKC